MATSLSYVVFFVLLALVAYSRGQCSTTLQQLINAAAVNSVVTVPACVYRESVIVGKPLTLVGYGAEIRGSDVWTSWTQVGSTWVSSSKRNHPKHIFNFSERLQIPWCQILAAVIAMPASWTVQMLSRFSLMDNLSR
jgi:hypothetical protein